MKPLPAVIASRTPVAHRTSFNLDLVHRVRRRTTCDRRIRVENFAAIDPNLYTDDAESRQRFRKSKVNVRTQRVKRQAALQRPLCAGDLGAVEAAGDHHLNALSTETLRLFHRLF